MEVSVGNGYQLNMSFDEALVFISALTKLITDVYASGYTKSWQYNVTQGQARPSTSGILEIYVSGIKD